MSEMLIDVFNEMKNKQKKKFETRVEEKPIKASEINFNNKILDGN